jgi:hypothetical protein
VRVKRRTHDPSKCPTVPLAHTTDPTDLHDQEICEANDLAQNGSRYSDKLTHPSDVEAWTHFDGIHGDKALEARNVRVAPATDRFNPFGITAAPHTCWPVFVIPLNLPSDITFQ